eukprot:scaffold1019_cov338-Pavlova_lutheri.AAC.25
MAGSLRWTGTKPTRRVGREKGREGRCRASDKSRTVPVPEQPEIQVSQAVGAVRRAWEEGNGKQTVELLLPVTGATELDDWPGGIKQQFRAAQPMVEGILKELKKDEGLSGSLAVDVLDEVDAVGVWCNETMLAVLFPTAEVLQKVAEMARGKRLVLLINPQWRSGQVISDFGLGKKKKLAEQFLSDFVLSYGLQQRRMLGEDIRMLRCFPGGWQICVRNSNGNMECIATPEELPSYKEIESMLRGREGSIASKSWLDRIKMEAKFLKDNL